MSLQDCSENKPFACLRLVLKLAGERTSHRKWSFLVFLFQTGIASHPDHPPVIYSTVSLHQGKGLLS